ncbi:TraX family protein [Paenibacillus physcomitrellae]|uniref:TraX protein n=1 Tax=Paenibacillus physcomitrellae TaxID=1619311 RepID=A0ABQ1FUK3_9BACL|nr:TraX family protein [Paenibacillus physcomitrellae]GGA29268.1 hypothetical protein GCM10010917_12810 [Paenibacillus physcomitrellae]
MNNSAVQLELRRRSALSLDGSTLKIIAIIAMLIDHIAAVILIHPEINGNHPAFVHTGQYMRMAGRLAFPIFCFLLVEGFMYTGNRQKYAMRLIAFAFLSEIPFDLAFSGQIVNLAKQNVFFTLWIGLLVMMGFEYLRSRETDPRRFSLRAVMGLLACTFLSAFYVLPSGLQMLNETFHAFGSSAQITLPQSTLGSLLWVNGLVWIIIYLALSAKIPVQRLNSALELASVTFIGVILATALHTDYGGFGIMTIASMYVFRRHRVKSMLAGSIILTCMSLIEIWAFLNAGLIRFYNGKRGLKLKYVFYLFYPVHLVLLYFIASLINKG